MRTPSRRMRDAGAMQAPRSLSLRLLPLMVPAGLAWVVLQEPLLLLVLAGAALLVDHQLRQERAHLAHLAAQRQGESICQFARAFPRREVDTWVIRADDRLKQDLWLDDDDLDLDLLEEMARLSGRSLERVGDNPWFGRVDRARDLVLFLDRQPRLAA